MDIIGTITNAFSFVEVKTVYIIMHLIGVAIGAGGAFMSDAMFFNSLKDRTLTKTELRFLKLGSKMVWIGLVLLIVSGILLFMIDTNKYMHSTKFLSKMTIVGIITLNGLLFHFFWMKRLKSHAGELLIRPNTFMKESLLLFPSGAISVVSWTFAIVLGAFKSIPYSYGIIMSTYFVCVFTAMFVSLIVRKLHLS